jgi:hypothetical protein
MRAHHIPHILRACACAHAYLRRLTRNAARVPPAGQLHYQDGSFLTQCVATFGEAEGFSVWEAVNCFFDTLPLAASIEGSVFCVHGGIPQELCEPGATLELIRQASVHPLPLPLPSPPARGFGTLGATRAGCAPCRHRPAPFLSAGCRF